MQNFLLGLVFILHSVCLYDTHTHTVVLFPVALLVVVPP